MEDNVQRFKFMKEFIVVLFIGSFKAFLYLLYHEVSLFGLLNICVELLPPMSAC